MILFEKCKDMIQNEFDFYFSPFGVLKYNFRRTIEGCSRSSFDYKTGLIKSVDFYPLMWCDKYGNYCSNSVFNLFTEKYVKENDFFKTMFYLKHEARHVQQFNVFARQEGNAFAKAMVTEYLAINKNPLYYKNNKVSNLFENYYYMLMEVDAEQFAVKEFYQFLNDYFEGDEQKVSDAFKRIVKDEVYNGNKGFSYVDEWSDDIDELMEKFDERKYKIMHENCRHFVDVNKIGRLSKEELDCPLVSWISDKESKYSSELSWNVVDSFSSSSDADKFVISISYDKDDELLNVFPYLDKESLYDMDYDKYFEALYLEKYNEKVNELKGEDVDSSFDNFLDFG